MTSRRLTFALLSDGPSDRVLLPILRWLLMQSRPDWVFNGRWFDPRVAKKPAGKLDDRIIQVFQYQPCDILFVHRDAENESAEYRRNEIRGALDCIKSIPTYDSIAKHKVVCIVPVRMTEAWLLFDETAIRTAADNPNGNASLELPPLARVESLPDPKSLLRKALIAASEATGRKKDRFERDLSERIHRVANLIENFEPLRRLNAFQTLETDIKRCLSSLQQI